MNIIFRSPLLVIWMDSLVISMLKKQYDHQYTNVINFMGTALVGEYSDGMRWLHSKMVSLLTLSLNLYQQSFSRWSNWGHYEQHRFWRTMVSELPRQEALWSSTSGRTLDVLDGIEEGRVDRHIDAEGKVVGIASIRPMVHPHSMLAKLSRIVTLQGARTASEDIYC